MAAVAKKRVLIVTMNIATVVSALTNFVRYLVGHPGVSSAVLLGLSTYAVLRYLNSPWRKLPPGPYGYPIIGNASKLSNTNWIIKACKKYGDIVYLGTSGPCLTAKIITERERFGVSNLEAAHISGSMYSVGSDTMVAALSWWTFAMVCFPEFQHHAQEELDSIAGRRRIPSFADLPRLKYLTAILREVIHWHPSLPLSVPHVADEDDWYEGMFIPKGTICFPNIFSLQPGHRDIRC